MELKEHQRENVGFLRGRHSGAVLDEQGLGKTFSVLSYLDELQAARVDPMRVLVVCPKTIKHTWKNEVLKCSKLLRPVVVDGSKENRIKALRTRYPHGTIFIFNYEGVRALRTKGIRSPHNVVKMEWDVVIADEMTKLKKHSTATSRSMHDFAKHSPQTIRIGMTGTPITQAPLEAFSQFMFVEPKLFGDNWVMFRDRYSKVEMVKRYDRPKPYPQINGYQNLIELTTKIHSVSIRHEKKNCLDLPPKSYQTIELEFDPEQERIYDEMRQKMVTNIGGFAVAAGGVLSKLQKLQEITGGWVYDEHKRVLAVCGKTNPKLDATMDILEGASRPILIWVFFKADVALLRKALTAKGYSFDVMDGDATEKERARAEKDFQAGVHRALICQMAVASYGLTLTAADTSVFFSQGWSVEDRAQAEDRIHRMGQVGNTHFIDLAIKDSVDVANLAMVREKGLLGRAIADKDLNAIAEGTWA